MINAGAYTQPLDFGRLVVGQIIDVVSSARWYNVRVSGDISIPCSASTQFGSPSSIGPSNFGVYAPNTTVLIYVPLEVVHNEIENHDYYTMKPPGYIISSVGGALDSNKYAVYDWIAPATGADAYNDLAQYYPVKAYAQQFRDFNSGRPMDAIPGSDQGFMNELGVGYGISRFFTWLRASELSGLWCFYLDHLTRMAAYNYEFWHSGGERWIKDDEGEVNDVDLFTPYPWEAMGVLDPNVATMQEHTDGGVWRPGQKNLWYEPRQDDQLMLPRLMKIRGYLGDAQREMVVMPKLDSSLISEGEDFIERYDQQSEYVGVLDVHKHTDGLYSVRSARGIHHEKYIFIPIPKQMAPPEEADSVGDGATNYKPSGYWGEGSDELHSKNTWAWSDSERPDTWAAEFYDYNAHMFNWYGFKSIVAHELDWHLPEEGRFPLTDVADSDGDTEGPVEGAYAADERLADSFMFPLPKFSEIQIDHRTGSSRYYYSRSVISQLPDGSILLEDGYGTSLHMTGGNIFMSGAGDIWLKPGRSVVMWAPDDLIARAGSSVDITASNADVRIKAERNMHILAGNSGTVGGLLLESRAIYGFGNDFAFRNALDAPLVGEDVQTYGLIVKAPNAPLMIYGRDVYTKAMSYNQGGGDAVGGNIVFEADQAIVSSGYSQLGYAEDGFTQVMGQRLEDGGTISSASKVNRFDVENAVISSSHMFYVAADNVVMETENGGIYARGPLNMADGVVPYPVSALESIITTISSDYTQWLSGSPASDDTLPGMMEYHYAETYDKGIKGDPTFIVQAGFTCRNREQYGLMDDFFIAEARWQQAYRSKDIGILWSEPAVAIPDEEFDFTRPHPGNYNWLTFETYREYESALWDWTERKDIDRSDTTETDDSTGRTYDVEQEIRAAGASEALKSRFLSTNYLISKQYGQESVV